MLVTILNISLVVIVVLIFLIALFSFVLVKIISKPKRDKLEDCIAIEKGKNFWHEFDQYESEKWNILSFDGYILHGNLIKGNRDKFVIITHGYTYTRWGSVKYTHIFHKLGYNVYIYDLRHHGENCDFFCSMGDYESRDIVEIAKAIKNRFGENAQIGLHGESLGASSSLLAIGQGENFSFVVADCGFSELGKLLEYQGTKKRQIPKFLIYTTSAMNRLLHGRSYYDIQPIKNLKDISVPILFIHGEDDTYIPCSMSKEMFEAYNGPKKIALFPGARHAQSYESNPEKYEKIIEEFCKTKVIM